MARFLHKYCFSKSFPSMKYNIKLVWLLASVLSILLINGCSKNTTDIPIPIPEVTYRGIYIDGFNNFLGDTAIENTALAWCQKQGFKNLSLYGLYIVTNRRGKYEALANFIKKAKTTYGMASVSAVHSTEAGFSYSRSYNFSRYIPEEKFDAFTIENEWWLSNPECDFECTKSMIDHLNNPTNPEDKLPNEVYIGWFNSKLGTAEPEFLVNNMNRILVHCYTDAPRFSYTEERLTKMATAAKKLGKKPEIVMLFSAETDFMHAYFEKNKTFEIAYQEFMQQLIQKSPSLLNDLNFVGYKIFAYTNAQSAIK
jgi:hypothetical protein